MICARYEEELASLTDFYSYSDEIEDNIDDTLDASLNEAVR